MAAVHYAAGPTGRMSHGLPVVVTVLHTMERRREVVNSVRASFHILTVFQTFALGGHFIEVQGVNGRVQHGRSIRNLNVK